MDIRRSEILCNKMVEKIAAVEAANAKLMKEAGYNFSNLTIDQIAEYNRNLEIIDTISDQICERRLEQISAFGWDTLRSELAALNSAYNVSNNFEEAHKRFLNICKLVHAAPAVDQDKMAYETLKVLNAMNVI